MIVKLVVIDNQNNSEIYSEEHKLHDLKSLNDLAELVANRIIELEQSYPPEKYSIEQIIYYNDDN
jgi:hypothetical protein